MKKLSIIMMLILVLTAGCSQQQAEETSANNDLLEVDAPNKLLTAADVDLTQTYNFAYNDQPIEGYDTYDNTNQISITPDQSTTLNVYGADIPTETVDFSEPYVSVDIKAGETYTFESAFEYYQIDSSNPTSAVISVA